MSAARCFAITVAAFDVQEKTFYAANIAGPRGRIGACCGMPELCTQCLQGATGEGGHAGLVFYVAGPYPGHNIFKCSQCGDRWIRHYGGDTERFGWTRYAEQLANGVREPSTALKRGVTSDS